MAGAATARDIAAAGFRVLLIEEHAAVGEPLHCSGLITPRTLELAGLQSDMVLNEFGGAFVNLASGTRFSIGGAGPYAVAVDRVRLDREIVAQAQEQGADLRTSSKLVNIERLAGKLQLSIKRPHGYELVKTRLLVGADGAQSTVARWLAPAAAVREVLVGVSVEARLVTEKQDYVEVFIGNSIAPGFFGWLIPLGDGHARIGIATNDGKRPIHYLRQLIDAFPKVFRGAEFGRYWGGLIPLTIVQKPFGDNVLLVGDAAGQVKPTSGGGIYTGLVGAKHCASAAIQALARDDISGASLSSYYDFWLGELGEEFERLDDLRSVFLSLSDGDLDRLAQLLGAPGLQRLIARHGDIDFPSPMLLRLARSLPALQSFVKVGLRFPWHRLLR